MEDGGEEEEQSGGKEGTVEAMVAAEGRGTAECRRLEDGGEEEEQSGGKEGTAEAMVAAVGEGTAGCRLDDGGDGTAGSQQWQNTQKHSNRLKRLPFRTDRILKEFPR